MLENASESMENAGGRLDLSGRRALVTGAGQGVGEGIAALLASAGAMVAVNDLVPERAESVAAALREAGWHAVGTPFDVTDFGAVEHALGELDGVDILINNAGNAGNVGPGFPGMAPFAETAPHEWEAYIRVNLYGVMHCTRCALPGMIAAGWGRVVTVVSDAGRVGEPNMAAYAAAKAGAAGFMRSIASEVGRHGVTANSISLGTMRTPLTEGLWGRLDAKETAAHLKGYAIRRPGLPEDVAGLVGYLVSPSASWITGQTIPLNGGYSFAL